MKVVFGLFLLLISCARTPIKSKDQAMRPYEGPIKFEDDLKFKFLIEGIQTHINYFESQNPEEQIQFGPVKVTVNEYKESLKNLIDKKDIQNLNAEIFVNRLRSHFDVFEVYGSDEWGEVFVTSYFDPVIKGSKKFTEKFSQPLYETPDDMVIIDYGKFVESFPKIAPQKGKNIIEQKSRGRILRGRIIESEDKISRVVPYFDREEMESDFAKKKLESKIIAWVDPFDAFFLQIQGSGKIQFQNGEELKVGYAAQNGHPYVPIGKFLLDEIPLEKMSLQRIESHLRSIPKNEAQEILNKNPSYVFFQKLESKSLTYMGTEVIPGRTIATDYSYFPKGTLGFLEYEKPIYSDGQEEPLSWVKSSRFIIDQDTGGAIRGPHRLDLYWGSGDKAKKVAGVMKNPGRLYYFVPKR